MNFDLVLKIVFRLTLIFAIDCRIAVSCYDDFIKNVIGETSGYSAQSDNRRVRNDFANSVGVGDDRDSNKFMKFFLNSDGSVEKSGSRENGEDDWLLLNNPLEIFSDSDYSQEEIDDDQSCLLDITTRHMSWWVYPNGTLVDKLVRDAHVAAVDLSHLSNNSDKIYEETLRRFKFFADERSLAFSAAANDLKEVPIRALALINNTLNYLSLRGNDFSSPNFIMHNEANMSKAWLWAQFPQLDVLKELDISHCRIQYIGGTIFSKIPNLEGLYLSHNNIVHLSSNVFEHIRSIQKLDMSYINSTNLSELYDGSDDYHTITDGLPISENAFKNLQQLIFLDVSHTKIRATSAKAFSNLGPNLQFLSLCYTSIPIIGHGMFARTNLKVLDLTGNPTATLWLNENSFAGIRDTLEILGFENSRLHDISWLRSLHKLEMIKLGRNNINNLHRGTFVDLKNLQLLDLSWNHIGNWYHRIFDENTKLRLLNLRNNNINILTSDMYRDFSNLTYLALGHNDFVCNCALRDLIDIAVANVDLMNRTLHQTDENTTIFDVVHNSGIDLHDNETRIKSSHDLAGSMNSEHIRNDIESKIYSGFIPLLQQSQENILRIKEQKHAKRKLYRTYYLSKMEPPHSPAFPIPIMMGDNCDDDSDESHLIMPDGEPLYFNFILLDYEPDNYWCFNASTNTLHELGELEPCSASSIMIPIETLNTTHFLIIGFGVLAVALILVIPLYLKWWYIQYFFLVVKQWITMRFLKGSDIKKNRDEEFLYDIFVSYCDRDRDWVLDELLPHMEGIRDTSICLHERDFQIGLSIIENIISCMDRSRCFLLVISKCFLSSQWCQFEMYIAQHRLFEAKKEHLIIIILEDIPKSKRPKTLQYLMQIKTYIKWPTDVTASTYIVKSISEERKLFWVRLRRSLMNIEHSNSNNISEGCDNESTV